MNSLPYEIKEQLVQCFGRCFHYKDNVESFFRSAGVSKELANKYRDQPKFVWAKRLLNDLEESDDGRLLQRKILTQFCRLRNLPDEVPDRDIGLDALRRLKNLANKYNIEYEEAKKETKNRAEIYKKRTDIVLERNQKLTELRDKFYSNIISANRQKSGYELEDLLKELFLLSEISFKKSYRTETQQIDGHFKFDGFDYLVEAKWRADLPNESEIGSFQRKVKTKLESTRGLFVSVNGFRDEVINQFNGMGANLILMNGEDLVHVLEGRVDLQDALTIKIEKASQYGIVYCKIC